MEHKSPIPDAVYKTEHAETATDTFNATQQEQQPNQEHNHDLSNISSSQNEISTPEDKKPEAQNPSHSGFHLPSPPALNDFSLPPSTFKVPIPSFMKQQKQHTQDNTSASNSASPERVLYGDNLNTLTSTYFKLVNCKHSGITL